MTIKDAQPPVRLAIALSDLKNPSPRGYNLDSINRFTLWIRVPLDFFLTNETTAVENLPYLTLETHRLWLTPGPLPLALSIPQLSPPLDSSARLPLRCHKAALCPTLVDPVVEQREQVITFASTVLEISGPSSHSRRQWARFNWAGRSYTVDGDPVFTVQGTAELFLYLLDYLDLNRDTAQLFL
ncbi:MAG: hypothetical protein Q9210_000412 [Variospora velana]